ncbi:uncharacterized protein PAC_08036 [Phialocephala subalpina]|uniref:CorA-like Mg2+ transporter protein n=1 Tax=Phialocephala subalpina TaxID=576137 RepID=A0A1L7WZE3_9HELO|nr:uncharacterized protein PAC_08036 [Phialocephala subalpina]
MGLREPLRIHLESLNIIVEGLGGSRLNSTEHEKWKACPELGERLRHLLRLLKYYEVTASKMVEQQRNLLSLAFNLETIIQGQAVARLNALAFIFLPLSFVASIFGITTFTASPRWYPAAAIPVLLATIAIAYVVNQILVAKPKGHS